MARAPRPRNVCHMRKRNSGDLGLRRCDRLLFLTKVGRSGRSIKSRDKYRGPQQKNRQYILIAGHQGEMVLSWFEDYQFGSRNFGDYLDFFGDSQTGLADETILQSLI